MTRLRDLPTLAEMQATRRATPKHAIPTRKAVKARKDRAAGKVVKSVRARCEERDGSCRMLTLAVRGDIGPAGGHECFGPSQWSHLGKTRARTRGQAPEARHATAHTLMLCKAAHDKLDGRAGPRLEVKVLTPSGADGPLEFSEANK